MVFDAGVGEEDEGYVFECAVCSRLAMRRSKSSSFSVTCSWLEASFEIASSMRSRAEGLWSDMGGRNESTNFVMNKEGGNLAFET